MIKAKKIYIFFRPWRRWYIDRQIQTMFMELSILELNILVELGITSWQSNWIGILWIRIITVGGNCIQFNYIKNEEKKSGNYFLQIRKWGIIMKNKHESLQPESIAKGNITFCCTKVYDWKQWIEKCVLIKKNDYHQ